MELVALTEEGLGVDEEEEVEPRLLSETELDRDLGWEVDEADALRECEGAEAEAEEGVLVSWHTTGGKVWGGRKGCGLRQQRWTQQADCFIKDGCEG